VSKSPQDASGEEKALLKTNTSISNMILLIGVAIVVVMALRGAANVKSATGTSNRVLDALDHISVMHSDSYWSPFDGCYDAGSTAGADCHQAHLPSLQTSLNRAEGTTTLSPISRRKPGQSSTASLAPGQLTSGLTNIAEIRHDTVKAAAANTR
jgi:hypothetical protein